MSILQMMTLEGWILIGLSVAMIAAQLFGFCYVAITIRETSNPKAVPGTVPIKPANAFKEVFGGNESIVPDPSIDDSVIIMDASHEDEIDGYLDDN